MKGSLEADQLIKNWPMRTISVSFSVLPGQTLALLRPSGCGKSSVLRMLCGLLAPDSGRVLLDGTDVTKEKPYRRGIGMVFQDHALFPHLNVEDNIGYGLATLGVGRKERRRIAGDWLSRFDLSGFGKRKIESLSGGEKQRVALIRTLVMKPGVILFDEPLSSLDAPLRRRLQTELRSRQQELGYTAVYVTHDDDEARVLADRIIRMEQQPDS